MTSLSSFECCPMQEEINNTRKRFLHKKNTIYNYLYVNEQCYEGKYCRGSVSEIHGIIHGYTFSTMLAFGQSWILHISLNILSHSAAWERWSIKAGFFYLDSCEFSFIFLSHVWTLNNRPFKFLHHLCRVKGHSSDMGSVLCTHYMPVSWHITTFHH